MTKKILFFISLIFINILFISNVYADEGISYQAHVQDIGWQNYVKNGEQSGTTGKAKRLEAIRIKLDNGNIEYQAHVQDIGWQNYVKDGELSGTTGKAKRLEAIRIKLTGEIANDYDVYYRSHVQDIGWMGWVKNGELSGTTGKAKRLEAIQIKLVSKTKVPIIEYASYVDGAWQNYVKDGELSGTEGKAKIITSFKIKLTMPEGMTGGIEYQSYITPNGWLNKMKSDEISGVYGKNIEAIKINLTGELSKQYDVYYRVHVSNIGWMGWTKNGKLSGTIDYFNTIEGLQIKLVIKDSAEINEEQNSSKQATNSVEYQSHVQDIGWQNSVKDGTISGTEGKAKKLESIKIKLNSVLSGKILYRTYVAKSGWKSYVQDYNVSGTTGLCRNIEAIQIKLDGIISNYYDIYYRVHVSDIGWLGWAKNDEKAGSVGNNTQIEAIQIKLVKKGLSAPGTTNNAYVTGTWKNNNSNYYTYFGQLVTGFRFIDGVKYYFNGEGTMMIKNAKEVIDVSSYQKNIDWDKIKKNGDIDAAIIRIGWGTSYTDEPGVDSYFETNIDKVKSLGIPYSVYIYSYAKVASAAEKEAEFVSKMMKKKNIPVSTFIWYDVEQGYSRSVYETNVPTFINKMKSLGYNNVGVYGNLNALESTDGYLNSSKIKSYPIWVAQYYKKLQYTGEYRGWQFTSSGTVDGISGRVDMNVFK